MRVGNAAPAAPSSGAALQTAVEAAEVELREVAADVEEARSAVKAAQSKVKSLSKTISALEVALPKAKLELESLKVQVGKAKAENTYYPSDCAPHHTSGFECLSGLGRLGGEENHLNQRSEYST
jgi:chromosome segregation ATPase